MGGDRKKERREWVWPLFSIGPLSEKGGIKGEKKGDAIEPRMENRKRQNKEEIWLSKHCGE